MNNYLELWLYIPPAASRILIELAAVRWARKGLLGIELLGPYTEQRAQLEQLLEPPSSAAKKS